MDRVGIIGAGAMGCGIAQVFLEQGFNVVLNDIDQNKVENGVNSVINRLHRKLANNELTEKEFSGMTEKLKGSIDLKELESCEFVLEAAIENIDVKKHIFSRIDSICSKDCIFGTNTSSLSITEIALSTKRPDKVMGVHFFNPAPVMKLVEIIKGLTTSGEIYEKVYNLIASMNKVPIKVKEGPGFVVNRLLIPMINEAVGIFAEGMASKEDIDKAMKFGANHPMGPLALGDLIGLDVVLAIMNVLHEELGEDKYRAHPLLKNMVRGGLLGKKSGEGFYKYQ